MLVTSPVEGGIIGTRYRDNSGLRARLSGRKQPEDRSIEMQLRECMLEREELAGTSRTRRGRRRKL